MLTMLDVSSGIWVHQNGHYLSAARVCNQYFALDRKLKCSLQEATRIDVLFLCAGTESDDITMQGGAERSSSVHVCLWAVQGLPSWLAMARALQKF